MSSVDLGLVRGESAFETWKKQPGNSGKNEQQFLESLKGAKGGPGAKGEPGTPGAPGRNGQTPRISMRIDERGHLLADITYE